MDNNEGYKYYDVPIESDDYPKYADGIEKQVNITKEIIGDDYPTYEQLIQQGNDGCSDYSVIKGCDVPFHAEPPTEITALENVLNLAKERVHSIKLNRGLETMTWDDSIMLMEEVLKKGHIRLKEGSNMPLSKSAREDDQ